MYDGKNPKALLSIRLITDALIRELRTKRYEDINVRALCQAADVSRQTFYNIFQTKEDVLRKCVNQIFESIEEQRFEQISARESIRIFVKTFYENREFMDLLLKNHLEKILTEEFVYVVSGLPDLSEHRQMEHLDYQLAFYAGGMIQVLIHWMQDEARMSSEDLIDILSNSISLPYF